MKQRLPLAILCAVVTLAVQFARADEARPVRLEQVMLNPQVVMHHAQELGLDETQQQAIRDEMQKAWEKVGGLEKGLQKEVAALHELLQQSSTDEQKALAQLDKVLDAERQIKRAHLSLSLAIRGKLTAEQQAKVRDIQQKFAAQDHGQPGGPPDAMKQKMQRLSALMDRAHQDGRDMSAVKPLMEELSPLMHQGKFKEAEPIIDRVLKMLDEGSKK